MRLRMRRHLRYIMTTSFVVLATAGVAAGMTGFSLGTGAACGCSVERLPNETMVTAFKTDIEKGKEVPVINWAKETPTLTKGCKGGKVVYIIEGENIETKAKETREVTLTENPKESENFTGNMPVVKPIHGKSTVKIKITGCKNKSEEKTVEFGCYWDPSGVVVDGNHENAPVWEATVTLLLSTSESGTYKAVENGSEIMSPANRVNPDKTGEEGTFGWEAIEDWYKVDATKAGCGSAVSPAFKIPPPLSDLEIVLHCEGEQWKLGEETGEKAQLAVTAPAKKCEGNVRVENASFGAAVITVVKETATECTIKKKGCETKKLNNGETCESELEKPGTDPLYELEAEWKGKKFTHKFPV